MDPHRTAQAEVGREQTVVVRPAEVRDIPALVRLRLANAEQHIALAPGTYRMPDAEAVRRHFEARLSAGQGEAAEALISVAELDAEVVGMAELVLLPEPPEHQILVPRAAAEIHTVVLEGRRGRGVGSALVRATERLAAERGVVQLYAGIFAANTDGIGFYSACGFGPRGVVLSKALGGQPRPH
ncbi:GNAT superfamily N-acetyltransferase [Streptacidiphilus sp. MAP12-33]|uniref:GNAT family N-acetyltransferase n=1 Tax=Streptacidiphilus sp. MAP12-33 TaxID=3156266 RepID=UPI003516FCB9